MQKNDLVEQITLYLSNGGLFNPELANHVAVRDLLIQCREALAQPEQEYHAVNAVHKGQQCYVKAQPEQTNTRPYYTIDELNAWADEKEKQAWRNAAIRIGEELSSVGPDGYYEMDAWKWLEWAMEQEPRGKNSLAQPEQEPVGRFAKFTDGIWREVTDGSAGVPLYTTPPQRTWIGLTNDEVNNFAAGCHLGNSVQGAIYKAESKLKEKNT